MQTKEVSVLRDGRSLIITVEAHRVKVFGAGESCQVTAYNLHLRNGDKDWVEGCGSENECHAFLRGVQAGVAMVDAGHVQRPWVPQAD